MIPKIIHYIWFGDELPEDYQKFINHWKKVMPDYEIMGWNLNNIKIEHNKYTDSVKSYAYLSDYYRLKILYEYGGIYLDTDVEVFKKFDEFLKYDLFTCNHYDCMVGGGVLGASKNNKDVSNLLDLTVKRYNEKHINECNNYIYTIYFINNYNEFKLNGETQTFSNIFIGSKDYFEQPSWHKNKTGYSLHHCGGSWYSKNTNMVKRIFKRLVGIKLTRWFSEKKREKKNPFYEYYRLQKKGIKPDNIKFD